MTRQLHLHNMFKHIELGPRAPSQYPKRRLSLRSRKVSKLRDLYSELSDRSEIWQALRQQCCRCACRISKRYDNLKYQSRGFETSRDLTIRRLFGYWDGSRFLFWYRDFKVLHIFDCIQLSHKIARKPFILIQKKMLLLSVHYYWPHFKNLVWITVVYWHQWVSNGLDITDCIQFH